MKEIHLQRAIVDGLNYSGALVWRQNAGLVAIGTGKGRRMIKIGVAGLSDIVGLYKGRFVAIEVKLPKRRKYVTSIQQQFLDNIKENGGIAGVATDVDEAIKIVKDQWKAGV